MKRKELALLIPVDGKRATLLIEGKPTVLPVFNIYWYGRKELDPVNRAIFNIVQLLKIERSQLCFNRGQTDVCIVLNVRPKGADTLNIGPHAA